MNLFAFALSVIVKSSFYVEDASLIDGSSAVSGINSSSQLSSEILMEEEPSSAPDAPCSFSMFTATKTSSKEIPAATTAHRGVPQYEDEVFSTDIDFPYGFWSENESSNNMATTYVCNPH